VALLYLATLPFMIPPAVFIDESKPYERPRKVIVSA
jgi:hypothetical protein